MKLISTLLLSAALAKRRGNKGSVFNQKGDADADRRDLPLIVKKIKADIREAENNDDEPISFKAVDDTVYPTHDPADFEGDEIVNLSENLSNPRNVRMLDVESGEELSENLCGFYHCDDGGASGYHHARHAINGEPLRQKSLRFPLAIHGFGFFLSHRSNYKKSAFVADIENSPTVGFVKLWPPINAPFDYSFLTNFAVTRVFVNDVECFQIENYTPTKVREMIYSEDGYNYPGMVYKCAENVKNAYTIRAHNDDKWLAFKEIEIYAPIDQTNVLQVPIEQSKTLLFMKDFNDKLAINKILTHGCHCSKYSDNEFTGGQAIDTMDKMCQDWNAKLKCLTLPGGSCENGIDFNFFNMQVYADGTLSDDLDFVCAAAESKCEEAICRVTYDWGMDLWASAAEKDAGSRKYDYKPNAQCFPQPPSGGEHTCVGEAPDVTIINN